MQTPEGPAEFVVLESGDPRTSSDIREPPRSLFKAILQIGPGLILAGSIVGTGELIATTGLGATQGYALLWLILLSCVIKVFVQVELGRYAITHGKTTLAAIDTLPGPRLGASWLVWLWLFMMLATQCQIAAMEALVGQAVHMAFPGASRWVAATAGKIQPDWGAYLERRPSSFWAVLTGLIAILLLISGGYRRLEKVTTTLVALVTLITVACVVALRWTAYPVNVHDLEQGLKFALPVGGLMLAFSTFGMTGVGASELYYYPYWCLEKGYGRSAGPRTNDPAWGARARGWMKVMQLDAWFSCVVFTVATVAFYILGAAVLKPQGLNPNDDRMIETLSQMYVGPLGAWTREIFLVGAWAVLFKTLYVATAGNSRLTADFLNLSKIWKTPDGPGRERVVKAFSVFYPVLALVLYFTLRNPKTLVQIGGAAQALMLPLISGAAIFLRNRDSDRRVTPWFITDILVWIAFFAISVVAGYYIVGQLSWIVGKLPSLLP